MAVRLEEMALFAATVLAVASACRGSSGESLRNEATGGTTLVATSILGSPTAIAEATLQAQSTPRDANNATPDASGGGTPSAPKGRVVLQGPDTTAPGQNATFLVRLEGSGDGVAAFNFDIVYDQRLVTLDAPLPDLQMLNAASRQWQCNLPPASGDVDQNPNIGRARLSCVSFGGAEAPAPHTPLTLATVTVRGIAAGTAELRLQNVAVFGPDETNLPVIVSPAVLRVK